MTIFFHYIKNLLWNKKVSWMLKFICGTIDAIQEYLFNSVEKICSRWPWKKKTAMTEQPVITITQLN